MGPKSFQNEVKIAPKCSQERPDAVSGGLLDASWGLLASGKPLGAALGASWIALGALLDGFG